MFSFIVQAALKDPEKPAEFSDLETIFANVLAAALGLAGIVLFVTLVMGGFSYLTAGGDPKKLEGAKGTITYAIYGIIFVALAYLFLRLIAIFTGVTSILNFQVVTTP